MQPQSPQDPLESHPSRSRRWQPWILTLILTIGLAIRWLAGLQQQPETSMIELEDGIEYLAQAKSLLRGKLDDYPRTYQFIRSPLYPLFLVPFEWLTPQEGREWTPSAKHHLDPPVKISTAMFRAIQAVQCLLSMGAALLVGRIAGQIAGPTASLLAIGFFSFNPFIVVFAGVVMTETLFLFLLWLSLHELMRYSRTSGPQRWKLLGSASVVLALGCLCRPNLQASLPMVAIWVGWIEWRSSRSFGNSLAAMTMITVLISAILLPLMIRNHLRHGELNLSPHYAKAVLAQGHSRYYFGALSATNREAYDENLKLLFRPSNANSGLPKEQWLDEPREFFREHRREWLILQWLKAKAFWRPWLNPTVFSSTRVAISAIATVPLFLGGFMSLLIPSIRRHPMTLLLWGVVVTSYLIGGFLFTASTRFRIPFLDVAFMVLAAAAFSRLLDRWLPGSHPALQTRSDHV